MRCAVWEIYIGEELQCCEGRGLREGGGLEKNV